MTPHLHIHESNEIRGKWVPPLISRCPAPARRELKRPLVFISSSSSTIEHHGSRLPEWFSWWLLNDAGP